MEILEIHSVQQSVLPYMGTAAVALGNFDGYHRGHQELVSRIVTLKNKGCSKAVVVSFNPSPKEFLYPTEPAPKLFDPPQKIQALREAGVDVLIQLSFNQAIQKMTHQEFYQKVLKELLQTKALVVGENFCFGFQRKGDVAWLKQQTPKDDLLLVVVPTEWYEDKPISSSRIRSVIHEFGELDKAEKMLGRPYCVTGKIVEGEKLGNKLGFPTANLSLPKQLIPKGGVYVGYLAFYPPESNEDFSLQPDKSSLRALMNIGYRPTVNFDKNPPLRIEGFILPSFLKDKIPSLYGRRAVFYFSKRVRDEKKFIGLEALVAQIQKDVKFAEDFFKN